MRGDEGGAETFSKDPPWPSPSTVHFLRPISFHRECVQCVGAPNWCGVIPIGRERDGMAGGSHVPLGTSYVVSHGEVVGLVGLWGQEHGASTVSSRALWGRKRRGS